MGGGDDSRRAMYITADDSMMRKADCPQCHASVRMPGSTDYERGILPDKRLEERVDAYTRCRDKLRNSLVRLDLLERERASGTISTTRRVDDVAVGGRGGAAGLTTTTASAGRTRRSSRCEGREPDMARLHRKDDDDERPSKRPRRSSALDVRPSPAGESGSDYDDDNDDECDEDYDDTSDSKMPHDRGGLSERIPPTQQQKRQLKRKATVAYHTMNKKKLVDICRMEGLSTLGNEAELRQRHSDYITLYNSECDSEHPRPVRVLLNEIRSREMSIKVRISCFLRLYFFISK